ncbi:MAG: RNase adapter RapZ [Anaerobiospirillum succiniciproducens]|uniref:RNase adapter RapZ n=1 Tax=Anaerobiospirillum succiniciproducens TaxID=13335 RepID=UPI002353A19D|nr:RNase adapter RapZ [Anaerobiospirillum succiniciproducens]MCI6863414.1 RNase adapter RapZ [Anaerobiospirillum succiniciproducens]MDY2799613.1 RNase adapter RapZ [Anaerobiospirillum succiniciproducens]
MGDASVQLVIISGRSGSGKTVALRALEDLGYYCIDNLPVMFLKELTEIAPQRYPRLAVSIDIRNIPEDDSYLESIFNNIKSDASIHSTLIFCDADDQVLVKRYSETRRLHPLSKNNLSLEEAILLERTKLAGISGFADLRIDTSELSVHSLSNEIVTAIIGTPEKRLVMVFESFGFKNGIAKDADFVFDARFLPNPFWEKELRSFTGLDQPVKDFFARYPEVDAYVDQIDNLLSSWLHAIESSNRSYLTVSVGCTGGCHRSVYIAQKLADLYHSRGLNVQVRHRSLNINSRLSSS